MAYIYCDCGVGMSAPTTVQIIESDYRCPSCQRQHPIDGDAYQEVILSMLQRIDTLEQRVHAMNTFGVPEPRF